MKTQYKITLTNGQLVFNDILSLASWYSSKNNYKNILAIEKVENEETTATKEIFNELGIKVLF